MENYWKTWRELNQKASGRKLVFFGKSGDWAVKTKKKINTPAAYMVDNSPNLIGLKFEGLEIVHPHRLLEEDKEKLFVVITTGGYESVVKQLVDLNLTPGEHFCCTPELNGLRVISEIRSHEQRLLISSPDHEIYQANRQAGESGGGIFVYDTALESCTKIMSGNFHQIATIPDGFLIVNHYEGVFVFSKDLELVQKFSLPTNSKPHGIAYCSQRNIIFVANSGLDCITMHDGDSYQLLDQYKFSEKYEKTGLEQHHINDLLVVGDSIFISYFSESGNFHRGVYDGGVRECAIDDMSISRTVYHDLWMPHSISLHNGTLCYLDTMRGELRLGNRTVCGKFPGFVRGLAYDSKYFYIGQSENRYYERLSDWSNYISIDTGFYVFDPETKVARFVQLKGIRQVHDIVVL